MISDKLAVITFNVQGVPSSSEKTKYRFKKIAQLLEIENVDIINLQEVFSYECLNILRVGLKKYPHLSYERSVLGPKGGLVTFSKLPLVKERYVPYPFVNLLRPALFRIFCRNIFSGKGVLVTRIKKLSVVILNTHFIANSNNDWSGNNPLRNTYLSYIKKLRRTTRSLKDYSLLILSGDFNIPVTSDLYKILITNIKMIDVYDKETRPTFQKELLPRGEKGNRLDYIFIKKVNTKLNVLGRSHVFAKKLISRSINRGYISDHLGLKVALIIN